MTESASLEWTDLDRRAVDNARVLAMDAVQAAGSGHPGTAMSLAPVAYLLYHKLMRLDPADPRWPGRDRFVLSAGHTSLTQYVQLYLSGYDLPLDELKRYRKWGSLTPGHPEVEHTAGIEVRGTAGARIKAMRAMADSLLGLPYVWGGGHSDFTRQPGYDCSGFVSAVLHAGGYLTAPADTTSLPSQPGMVAGPGQYVTVYDRAPPGQNGHVIIEIGGQFYESGGSHGAWGGGGGVEKIGRPSAAYLASFPTVLHPAGL